MKRKSVVSMILVSTMVLLAGCGSSSGGTAKTGTATSDQIKTLESAIKEYQDSTDTKEVYVSTTSGSYSSSSIEVYDGDNSYREIEYSADSSDSDSSDDSSDSNNQYILYDWTLKDGTSYILNSSYDEDSEDSKLWIEMPEGYGSKIWSRTKMFTDVLYDSKSVNKEDNETITSDSGDEELDMYSCTVSSDKIKDVLEIETSYLVEKEKDVVDKMDDSDNKTKVLEFLNNSIEDYASVSAYAEGKMYFGLKDGKLKYTRLETGGLGSSYSVERILMDEESDVRDVPTFEDNTSTYYDLILSYVEYIESQSTDSASGSSVDAE